MSLYQRFLAAIGWPGTYTDASSNNAVWYGPAFDGLPAVTEKTILSVSAAYACVNLIAGAISALPVRIYREGRNGDREEILGDNLWWTLNEQFLPRWSASNGWEYIGMSLLLHGDAFAAIRRTRNGEIVGFEPAHPKRVQVVATKDRRQLLYQVVWDDGTTEVIEQDDMIHVAGFGFNGFRSVSPLTYVLGTSAGVALATQEYAGRFFTNSARPDVVITTDQVLNQEQADQLKARWMQLYSGYANAHQPAVFGNGAKVMPLTMSAEDAQLLATRQFQIEEIARAFGVPPFMIGHVEKTTSWGSGVESMGKAFVRFTLRQHLKKIETELNRKCFRNAGKRVEFDTFDLESADMKTLFESFRIAVGRAGEPGFMTTDEVRDKLRLKRTTGGNMLNTGTTNATQPTA